MVCKHCGEQLADGAKFCENCGNKVEEVVNETFEETNYKEPERVEAEVVGEEIPKSSADEFKAESNASVDDGEKGPIGFSIASLVCGILGLLCCCCGWIGAIFSVAGIVLGVVSLNKKCEGKGMAIAGIVCGGIGALTSIIALIVAAGSGSILDELDGVGNIDQIEDFLDSL